MTEAKTNNRKPKEITEPVDAPVDAPETVSEQRYYLITAREYLVTFPPYTLILYPGTSAVLRGEELDLLAEQHRQTLTIQEISEQEYGDIFKKQGRIGWVNR